jgi:hypothetical protein
MTRYTFRPLPIWPHKPTPNRRSSYTFRAGWQDTIDRIGYEIDRLGGSDAIIGAGFREGDIRRDGLPRADARQPAHPGIELSFDSRHGRLVYATDAYDDWQANARAIALGLEALRAVDRYGISSRGEQYAGWLQLETSAPSATRGRALVEEAGGIRQALMRHHPDHGGDPRALADVQAYRLEAGER